MKLSKKCPLLYALAVALVCVACEGTKPTVSSNEGGYDWNRFGADIAAADDALQAKLPERIASDPEINARSNELILAGLARGIMEVLIADRDHPIFLPALNIALNIMQPNADTIYKGALIAPGGVYQLRGNRGTVPFFLLGELTGDFHRTGVQVPMAAYHNFDSLTLDADGNFEVILSPTRPEGYSGDWWQSNPKTEKLLLRQISYDWAAERDPAISIQRLDAAVGRSKLSEQELSRRLSELSTMAINASNYFVDHVDGLRDLGYINSLKVFDVQGMAGIHSQSYYEGAYQINDDEALIVSVKIPEPCKYWSLILTNDIYQTTDWFNNQSSLNGAQAQLDNNGVFNAVISNRDPGVFNWLDTSGYLTGAMQGRWLECAGSPMPTVTKVKLAGVASYLPPETTLVSPEEREQMIRDRVAAAQQRRLW